MLQLSDGKVRFTDETTSLQLDDDVSDGEWHHVEAKWKANGDVILKLDHGLREASFLPPSILLFLHQTLTLPHSLLFRLLLLLA